MSNDQNLPFGESTKTHGQELPPSEGTLTHHGQPIVEGTGVQGGVPSVVALTGRHDDPIPGYQILEKLGRGGMGVVHLAKDLNADRLVALKRIVGDSIQEIDRIRFRTEAQAIARLKHPQIIQIYDVSKDENKPYFTMEYCPGGTLGQFLDRKPQTPLLCAQIAEKIALGIHHAHENGIIHRDLKPSNILIAARWIGSGNDSGSGSSKNSASTPNSQAPQPFSTELLRITDFGLAKKLDAESHLTQTQAVIGTPSYMAPEQATSTKQAGPGADIWAIGVMLYEMITGSLPFVGADSLEIIDHLRSRDPIPPSDKVKVPPDLETICLKCLRKDPKDRYVSAQELAEDLRAFQEERSISARPMSKVEKGIRWARRNPLPTVLGSVTALSLILGTIVSLLYANKAEKAANEEQLRSGELKDALKKAQQAEEKEKERSKELEHLNANANLMLASAAPNVELGTEFLYRVPPDYRQWEWEYLKTNFLGGLFPLLGHAKAVNSVSWSPDGKKIVSGSSDTTLRIWDAQTGKSLQELKGHTFSVLSVNWSPDGKKIVSSSYDNTLRIWDAQTGHSLMELKKHTHPVWSVGWSPDGKKIASGCSDSTLRIWDAQTGHSLYELEGHTGVVRSVSWSPDGKKIVSSSDDKTLRIWDVEKGKSLFELQGHSRDVHSVSWSPDGKKIASGSSDTTLRIWDAQTGKSLQELKGHAAHVLSVGWSPDGKKIASGSLDHTLRIWDAQTGQSLLELKGQIGSVWSISWSPDGKKIVSSSDNTLRIWDAHSAQSLQELQGHADTVWSIAWSPDGKKIVSGSSDKTLRIWDAQAGQSLLELQGHGGEVWSVAWSPDGKKIAGGSRDRTLRIWEAQSGQLLFELQGHTDQVLSVNWSPDGKKIASGSWDKTVRIWDTQTGFPSLELKGHTDKVLHVTWSPDGKKIASGSDDNTLRIWDVQTGQSLSKLQGHTKWVNQVSWSPDGNRIVSGSSDNTLRIWDAQSGQSLLELKGHTESVHSVGWSPDGKKVVSGSSDKTLRIWDTQSGQSLLELKGHTDIVRSTSWSPDGKKIVGSLGKTLRIWDIQSGQSFLGLNGHTESVHSVAWSPDRKKLASSSSDKTLRIWDAQTGQSLLELKGHSESVHSGSWSPDGKRIVSGSYDKTLRIWDTQSGQSVFELKGHTGAVWSVSWSPDGKKIASSSDDQTLRIWDAQTGQSLFELKAHIPAADGVSWSLDGKKIVTRGISGETIVLDANLGERLSTIAIPETQKESNLLNPQGKQLVFWSGNTVFITAPEISQEEIVRRRWLMRQDVHWHLREMEKAIQETDPIGFAHHRYWFYRAQAEAAFLSHRFTEALGWEIGAAQMKTRWAEIPEHLPKPKDFQTLAQESYNRGLDLLQKEDFDGGLQAINKAIDLIPGNPVYRYNRGLHLYYSQKIAEAEADFQIVLQLREQDYRKNQNDETNRDTLAWFLATCPLEKFRDGKRAVQLATANCEKSKWQNAWWIDTLAAAYAECGQFDEAVKTLQKALDIPNGLTEQNRNEVMERLKLYQEKKPYR